MNNRIAVLKDLMLRQVDLVAKLERSLAIKKLWPEAFDKGKVASSWLGTPIGRGFGPMLYDLRFRVTAGDEIREFVQIEVSEILWPNPKRGYL